MDSSTPVIKLSRFRADVARALAKRGHALLESDNLPAQVQALAPLEAYFIVKELGVDDALPVLHHATDEQVQACIDLDCWDGDTFSPEELDAWLAAFAHDGPEALAAGFKKLDQEVQVLFVASSLFIFDTRSDNVPDTDDDVPRMTTTDGFFVLCVDPKLEREVEPFTLINALYRDNVEDTIRLLVAAKWELPSATQEQAWQFRAGRIADLGFPDPDVAARIFAPPAQNPPPIDAMLANDPVILPAVYAAPLTDTSLLCRAMGHIADPTTLLRLENELVQLVNAAVIAYGDSPRDLQHVADVATYVRDTLSLGLETLVADTHADPATQDVPAADLLGRWPLRHIFQTGFAQVRPLHQAARALAQDPIIAAWLNVTLAPDDDPERHDRAFLRALVRARPLCSGYDAHRAERSKAWSTQADVQASQERLDALSTRLL